LLYATERRWIIESEYASDGWVILVGSGINPSPGNDTRPIDYAFVRMPGEDGGWYRALGGTATLHDGKLGDGGASLTTLTPFARSTTSGGSGTLDVDRASTPPKAEATLDTLVLTPLDVTGSSCNPETTRCTFDMTSGLREVRPYLHASASMNGAAGAPIDHGFVLIDDGPWTQLSLSTISRGSGSTAQTHTGLDVALHLRGLSTPVRAASASSTAPVVIRWTR
jgi:hypothetical protein